MIPPAALAAWLLSAAAAAGTLRVDMLDVGQGDAILITSPAGKRVLIDAATAGGDVRAQLGRLGVGRLDLVVATHPHADHIGGMRAVIEDLEVGRYMDSGQAHTTRTYEGLMEAIEARGVRYQTARAGQTIRMDDRITLEVLWPGEAPIRGTRSDLNSNSVVLRLDHGESCFLFTGDAEEPTERRLIDGGRAADCDVLKVAHHGSDHSTSAAFLQAVAPSLALVSCGEGNRYDHPGPETMARLADAGVIILRTDTTGHITLQSDGAQIAVTDGLPWGERATLITDLGGAEVPIRSAP